MRKCVRNRDQELDTQIRRAAWHVHRWDSYAGMVCRPDGSVEYLNKRWLDYTDYLEQQALDGVGRLYSSGLSEK